MTIRPAEAELPSPDSAGTDELFAAVANLVPSFGGMYVDESTQTLHIWLTGGGQALAAAKQAIVDVFQDPDLADLTPVAHRADYTWAQLSGWNGRLNSGGVMGQYGVHMIGFLEGENRLMIGVDPNQYDQPGLEAKLAELNVPPQAVVVREVPPIEGRGGGLTYIAVAIVGVLIVAFGAWLTSRRSAEKRRATDLSEMRSVT